MTTLAIVQARMSSTRLPGKALLDICGEPMLARVIDRSCRATQLDGLVVATTSEPADDVLHAMCVSRGWACFRGSENDVLDRYYQAATQYKADVVVRITSDCPVIDPDVIDYTLNEFLRLQPECDYVSNGEMPRPFPRGLDVEALHYRVLEQAWREAKVPAFREHVTPYIYRHPEKFRIVSALADRDYSDQRWTVDTPEDRDLLVRLYEHFGHDRFNWREIIDVLNVHPDWRSINSHVKQKQV